MSKSLQQFRQATEGKYVDLDNQSYDCVDVSRKWAGYLTGNTWIAAGNAKDLYRGYQGDKFKKIEGEPKSGDIFVSEYGYYGHTGVVIDVKDGRLALLEQDTYAQKAATIVWYNWVGKGYKFLRPLVPFTRNNQPDTEKTKRPKHKPIDAKHLEILYRQVLRREPDAGAYEHYVGKQTIPQVRADLLASDERKRKLKIWQEEAKKK